ncbi:MAG: phospholipase D family protein [Ideonella sp.]|nr:phospholipase D family protein [Ideonella sp.]
MPEFLTTSGLNYHLEKLLQEAELEILLISPYIKLAPKIRQLLVERRQAGVKITVACRVENLQESQESLESLAECADPVLDLPRLHAKCYVSERGAIVGSMNLHESSQRNNSEMGIYVRNAEDDAALYSKVLDEARRLCAMSSACPDVEPAFPPLVVGQSTPSPISESASVSTTRRAQESTWLRTATLCCSTTTRRSTTRRLAAWTTVARKPARLSRNCSTET